MKKSLLALAAMGAFAGAAHAQSSVTVSGLLEAGYTSKSIRAVGSAAGAEVAQSGITGGHFGTPVLRVEGTEDLGGGVTAGFAIRDEFNTGTGARASTIGVFTESFVSLTSKQLGSLSAGRMYPASRDLGGVYRFMGDIGRINVNLNSTVNSNTVQYVTPAFQGFSASAAYTATGKTASSADPTGVDDGKEPMNQIAIGLRGTIAKASLAASLETQKIAAATVGADQAINTITSVGASYDFGVAKLGAAYFDQKLTLAGGADGGKRNAYTINLAAPVTKVITLGASFASYEVSLAAGGDKPKANIMTFGAQYALSKRTSIYGSYQQVTNSGANDALKSTAAGGITAGTTNGSSRGLGVMEINGGTGRGFGLTAVHTF
jgi:GBP family porin